MAERKEPVRGADLKQQVEELRHSNEVLQTENDTFESFLSRLDSLSMASQMEKEAECGGEPESSGTSQEPPNHLDLEQKYYIAVCELEEMTKEPEIRQRLSRSLTGNAEYYKAAIEDSDRQLAEITKERHDFEQFVAKTLQRTQVLPERTQKIIRFIERKINAKKALTERMLRSNAFLRTESKKQQRMMHQKEQMQDTFSEIDLEYLKEKIAQYRESLRQFQEELLCQRLLIRKSQKCLNIHKEQLKIEMQESESLSRQIAAHEETLSKIREQQQKAEKAQAQAEALNKKLKAQSANFRVPDVMTYVEAKVTNDQLRQTVKSLERKARIAEMSKKHNPE